MFKLEDLGAVQIPVQLCAYGSDVEYVLKRTDAKTRKVYTNLWRVSALGGPAVALTRGDHKDHSPIGDPAGAFFVFVSDRSGSPQLWRMDRDSGEPRRLTSFPDGSLGRPAIAADGCTLAVLFTPTPDPHGEPPLAADLAAGIDPDVGPELCLGAQAPPAAHPKVEPRARVFVRVHNRTDGKGWETWAREQVWRVDPGTGDAHRLAAGPWAWGSPQFAADGSVLTTRTAVPEGDADQSRNELVRLELSGTANVIPRPEGLAWPATESPNGRFLAYVHFWPDDHWGTRNAVPTVIPASTGIAKHLGIQLDLPAGDMTLDDVAGGAFVEASPVWTSDDTFVIPFTEQGAVRLWQQIVGGRGRWLTEPAQCATAPVRVGGQLVCIATDTASYPEVARVDDGGLLTRITRHNAALQEQTEPRAPRVVWIQVGEHTVHGWFLAPRQVEAPVPAILYIHGGPHANYGDRMFFEMQWLADQGFAVLWTNPRGSTSYGEHHCGANDGRWGQEDREDLLAAATWLAHRPEVDAQRIGVAGGSYGGYMSLELAGTSDLFAAAVAQRGLFDWSADYGESDFGFCVSDLFGGKAPWQDPEAYRAQSPVRHLDNVTIPFLLLCQEGDMRVEEAQSLTVFNALRARGVPTGIVILPEENHGMMRSGRIDRRQEAMRQIAGWFARYL